MKKLFYVLVVGVVTAFLCMGCGSDKADITETGNTEQQTTEEATAIPEETLAPTPEATEEPREEVTIENEKPEATPEPTEEPTPEPTEEPVPQYTYTDMSATMYAQQTVNIRDLPDADGNKLGSLSTNDEITITGQCNETSWYRFEYNGSVAYVSDKYVGENRTETIQTNANNFGSSASKHWYDGYEMYTWYDMGSYFFFLVPPTTTLQENTGYLNAADSEIIPKLEERYPGKSAVSVGGWGAAWTNEIHTLVFDAVYIVDGAPQWEYGTHIWE